jgi:hypothetical protein
MILLDLQCLQSWDTIYANSAPPLDVEEYARGTRGSAIALSIDLNQRICLLQV